MNGYKAFLVGGAVRDIIMGRNPNDFDVATNATPNIVCELFRKVIPTGIAHGTVTVFFMGYSIEVTTFRSEEGYSDFRHPDNIKFVGDINSDLLRRDFTINALACDLSTGKVLDITGGVDDIHAKIIRAVGQARERFLEDALRPIRAIRFMGQLGFSIEESTKSAIFAPDILEGIRHISRERFRDEFIKMMGVDTPSACLKTLHETGILKIFMASLEECFGCQQLDDRKYHLEDVATHCLSSCDFVPKNSYLVRIATLLHDIGKPATRQEEIRNGMHIVSFHNHETIGAELAKELLTNLHFSTAQINRITHLIECHMFYYDKTWTAATVRRFLAKVKAEYVEDLIVLARADRSGKVCEAKDAGRLGDLDDLHERLNIQIKKNAALSVSDLRINGKDIICLGIKQGPAIGIILKKLLEMVLEDPTINTKEQLVTIAKTIIHDA